MSLKQKTQRPPEGNEWVVVPVSGLSGAGSVSTDALAIPAGQDMSVFTTVASGTGARLPASGVSKGEEYVVSNHGANALLVYPPAGGKMGTASTDAGYSLAAGKTGYFLSVGLLQFTVNP